MVIKRCVKLCVFKLYLLNCGIWYLILYVYFVWKIFFNKNIIISMIKLRVIYGVVEVELL